jgi:hypothetical protein
MYAIMNRDMCMVIRFYYCKNKKGMQHEKNCCLYNNRVEPKKNELTVLQLKFKRKVYD